MTSMDKSLAIAKQLQRRVNTIDDHTNLILPSVLKPLVDSLVESLLAARVSNFTGVHNED